MLWWTSSTETWGWSSSLAEGWKSQARSPVGSLLWRADLRKAGYNLNLPWKEAFLNLYLPTPMYDSISFSGDEILLATAVHRMGSDAGPRRVQAVLLDAHTGKVLANEEWVRRFNEVGVFAAADGKFLLRGRHQFSLYSSSLEELGSFPLPPTRRPVWENWSLSVLPNRKYIVVEHYVGLHLEVQWLDPNTLQVQRTWRSDEGLFGLASKNIHGLSVSENQVAATRRSDLLDHCEVFLTRGTELWGKIFGAQKKCHAGAQFVNEKTLFLPMEDEVLLLDTDGQVVTREPLRKKEFALYARTSANGRRVAIPINTFKGGSALLDISPRRVLKRVMIYDLAERRWVFTLDGERIDLKNLSGFALSPDGLRLALLRDGAVEVYRLPN